MFNGKSIFNNGNTSNNPNVLAGLVNSFNGRTGVVVSVAGDYTASQITNVPAGSISSTNVQDAINELDTAISAANVYSQTFNATIDWGAASGGLYTITITAATHGFALNVSNVAIYETSGADSIQTFTNQVIIDNITGDVSFNVSEAPDGRFAGKVLIIKGSASGAGSGITSLNGLIDEVQLFATGTTGSNFNISSVGNTHIFNIPNADVGVRGILSSAAQNIGGAKTFVTDTATLATGLAIYNPNITDNNGLDFNYLADTTGGGAQTAFPAVKIRYQVTDHDNTNLTSAYGIYAYQGGVSKIVLGYDGTGQMYTDATVFNTNAIAAIGDIEGVSGIFSSDVVCGAADAFYLGNQNSDGSWRFIRSGSDLLAQTRIAGVWTTKDTILG